jgi:hypothetical protein
MYNVTTGKHENTLCDPNNASVLMKHVIYFVTLPDKLGTSKRARVNICKTLQLLSKKIRNKK